MWRSSAAVKTAFSDTDTTLTSKAGGAGTVRPWQRAQKKPKSAFDRLTEANIQYWQTSLTPTDKQMRRLQACQALVRLYLRRHDKVSARQVLDDAVAQLARVRMVLEELDLEIIDGEMADLQREVDDRRQ